MQQRIRSAAATTAALFTGPALTTRRPALDLRERVL